MQIAKDVYTPYDGNKKNLKIKTESENFIILFSTPSTGHQFNYVLRMSPKDSLSSFIFNQIIA